MFKVLAAALMLVDHIGLVFFPQYVWIRWIGRLSMPLFAHAIATGYYYSKRNGHLGKYARNLIIFSIASQLPYMFMLTVSGRRPGLNIGFTWVLALAILAALDQPKSWWWAGALAAIAASIWLPISYGLYGIVYPLVFYLAWQSKALSVAGQVIINVAEAMLIGPIFQALAIVSAIPATFIKDRRWQVPKSFFYLFYPVHLAVLAGLRVLLETT